MARSSSVPRRVDPDATRRAFSFRTFGEVVQELKRVTWPGREETMRLTLMVVAVSATVGVFLGLVDIGFARIFDVILNN
jgi:preprotein translocase subunit SecE